MMAWNYYKHHDFLETNTITHCFHSHRANKAGHDVAVLWGRNIYFCRGEIIDERDSGINVSNSIQSTYE